MYKNTRDIEMRASNESLCTKITIVSKIHKQSVPVRYMGKMPQSINQWLNNANYLKKLLSEKITDNSNDSRRCHD